MRKACKAMKNWIKAHKAITGLAVFVVVAVVGFLFVRNFFQKKDAQGFAQEQQNTISLSKMDLTSSISATGTIESSEVRSVSAGVSNIEIASVEVSAGDNITKGDILLTFDKSDLQDALTEAQDNLEDAQTQANQSLSSANRQMSSAQSSYTTQKTELSKNVNSAKKSYDSAKKKITDLKKQIKRSGQQRRKTDIKTGA